MKMGKLGFGLMRLPLLNADDSKSIDKEQVCRMADTFLERGFTYFDTAYMYHDHESERAVKDVITKRYARDSYTLATKLPLFQLEKKEDMERIFNEQLEKTGQDFFDYYLLHAMSGERYELVDRLGGFEFIAAKKAAGKVRHIGFSFHDKAEVLDRILTDHPEVEFVQLQLNYLDWEDAKVQSRKCYETAVKHGKKVVVMEPVKGGTLAKLPEKAEKLLRAVHPDWSNASWAIRFAASLENVMIVLSGMSSMEQMLDNSSYMQDMEPLTEEEKSLLLGQVVDIIHEAAKIPCTACRYCVEGCPMDIAIPDYFALYNAELEDRDNPAHSARYEELSKEHGKASDCVECGQCESVCPQQLKVTDWLKKTAKVFEK
ncbi:MAG: aldo/keto reductase [Lachnospiraceae bacterium]|nr:aldo/keto reductase [Lachnospiraceae bacterium]